ncbi:protein cramped [Bicyclus anynana]|uniref:Protein cramped n=1 Tax=Bicyclus anynana TaxID=110368 RepID=A0ABM3LZT0_BICAN|nr:protein cramped [Bicyclus anynana]
MATPSQSAVNTKICTAIAKPGVNKVGVKESAMSPGQQAADEERTELLGSLTTEQQQRTSARVIKKLRLEPPVDKRDVTECETPNKMDEKELLKFPTVKQRMPKALWSADEKSLFFEALNEYGKDFDAITAYICAKMKKKGMPDANLKTKMQVSHFYYRTWHKLSKHVHFDENVKKVAQELYALINYGELRRKLASVNEKTCARLSEMVRLGSMAVRARGKTVKVRTPMCRALKRLNQIAERAGGARVCSRAQVLLRARSAGAWTRVQAAAHNPRAALALPLRTRLAALLRALDRRWKTSNYKNYRLEESIRPKPIDEPSKEVEEFQEVTPREGSEDLESHLQLQTDRVIVEENHLPKKPTLHLGPRPDAQVHLPVLSPSEQLSSQKICFSSYLERMGSQRRDKDNGVKIRTPKRQRKDSNTDKDKEAEKKMKLEDPTKLDIDETAIDGIELMAHYKHNQEDEEKPSTEDEKELKSEETAEEETDVPERDKDIHDKDMSEREKDSFSEMEDDEKYTKSDTDNESDGKADKSQKERKFKNLKVKFRIVRPQQRGGNVFKLILEKHCDESKTVEVKSDDSKIEEIPEDTKPDDSKCEEKEEEAKPDFDMDLAIRQIKKGWSAYDAGDLTIGDLYLMFGNRSKLELDYWWAIPTPPLPQPAKIQKPDPIDKDKHLDKREKGNKTPDKGDSSVEDEREKRESDMDIFSPKNTFSQDSNDGMSGDERKSEQLSSPDHKSAGTLKLVHKLINNPTSEPPPDGFALISDRLKRLLALAGNAHAAPAAPARCECAHVCPLPPKNKQKQPAIATPQPQGLAAVPTTVPEKTAIFKQPTPIAPKNDSEAQRALNNAGNCLDGLPKWRRGRPRQSDRRVVVQRELPLLPKLPPASNVMPVPVKLIANPSAPPLPVQPRLLPKPPPAPGSDFYYILSESNGQFLYNEGNRRITIDGTSPDNGHSNESEDIKPDEDTKEIIKIVKIESLNSAEQKQDKDDCRTKTEQSDIASFLPTESMSLSPSRLLRDAEGWLEGSVQDFSLSSFLGHLEGRPQPELSVDSQLRSLMAESSVDYVAKFADLAAEVTDEADPLADDLN